MGYRCLGCPVSFCRGFNISLLIEQHSLLLYNNGNFDPGSYTYRISTLGIMVVSLLRDFMQDLCRVEGSAQVNEFCFAVLRDSHQSCGLTGMSWTERKPKSLTYILHPQP